MRINASGDRIEASPELDMHAASLHVAKGWEEFLATEGAGVLESALRDWLPRQRWFGAKTRDIESVRAESWVELALDGSAGLAGSPATGSGHAPVLSPAVFFFRIAYFSGPPDTYQIPLATGLAANLDELAAVHPGSIIAKMTTAAGSVLVYDATHREEIHQALLRLIASNTTVALMVGAQSGEAAIGQLEARASTAFPAELGTQGLPSRVSKAEQSNTSVLFGDQLFLKLFRRLQPEENPDVEVGRFLTEVAHFNRIPPFLGEISLSSPGSQKTTVALLQGMVPNQGDGWRWFLDELSRWLASVADRPAPETSRTPEFLGGFEEAGKETAGGQSAPGDGLDAGVDEDLDAAALLGRCTAEMHLALSGSIDQPAFAPEPMTAEDLARDALRIEMQIHSTLEALEMKFSTLDDSTRDVAEFLLSSRPKLLQRARSIAALQPSGQRIRIHGDYHLGQTLRTAHTQPQGGGDFVLIDFEGEPARPIEERRKKQSPLRDVAGMMRSFSYAAYSALDQFVTTERVNADANALSAWADWWQNTASAIFLRAYVNSARSNPNLLPTTEPGQVLLKAYLLEKGLYEVLYELDNRPGWLRIPINGILALLKSWGNPYA